MEKPEGPSATESLPGEIDETYARAKALFAEKKFDEVITLCEAAEAAGKYNADIAAVHSATLLKLRKTEEAVDYLSWMLYYFPNDARLHLNLGTAHSMNFKRTEANSEYAIARQLDPALAGDKLKRVTYVRIGTIVVAFLVFFVSFLFWPHTRWLVVVLIGGMMTLNVFILYRLYKAHARDRMLIYGGMLVLWAMLLILVLLIPALR